MVNSPPKIHRPINSPGVSTHWAMIERPKKMPEPIIDPTTRVVASNSRKCRCSWGALMVSAWEGCGWPHSRLAPS